MNRHNNNSNHGSVHHPKYKLKHDIHVVDNGIAFTDVVQMISGRKYVLNHAGLMKAVYCSGDGAEMCVPPISHN